MAREGAGRFDFGEVQGRHLAGGRGGEGRAPGSGQGHPAVQDQRLRRQELAGAVLGDQVFPVARADVESPFPAFVEQAGMDRLGAGCPLDRRDPDPHRQSVPVVQGCVSPRCRRGGGCLCRCDGRHGGQSRTSRNKPSGDRTGRHEVHLQSGACVWGPLRQDAVPEGHRGRASTTPPPPAVGPDWRAGLRGAPAIAAGAPWRRRRACRRSGSRP